MRGKVFVAFCTVIHGYTLTEGFLSLTPFVEIPDIGRPYCYDVLTSPTSDWKCSTPHYYDLLPLRNYGCVGPPSFEGKIIPPIADYGCLRPQFYDEESSIFNGVPSCHSRLLEPLGYNIAIYDGAILPPIQECGCVKPRCSSQLILPPVRTELPRDLGYLPAAVPVVASYYTPAIEVPGCAGASVPVMSPCSCLALATPVCPDIAPLVRSIKL